MRETLDYLAPDDDVVAQPNFKLEKDQSKPTMKQKARFILKARGMKAKALKTPEQAIDIIEEKVSLFARSTYTRSNISAHVATEISEILYMKNYLNAVLAELLALN